MVAPGAGLVVAVRGAGMGALSEPDRTVAAAGRCLLMIGGLVAAGVLGLAAVLSPADLAAGEPYAWFGVAAPVCPGCWLCGASRAFSLLLRGQLAAAGAANAVAPVLFVLDVGLALAGGVALVRWIGRCWSWEWRRSCSSGSPWSRCSSG
mgnify:CR=1 FL=1